MLNHGIACEKLITTLKDKGINDERVLDAFRKVPRHLFVNNDPRAYDDCALPIGLGQTISQPYIVALMTQLLELERDQKILEIGTGSGFQTAVLAQFSRRVYTVERHRELGNKARQFLRELGYANITFKIGDGTQGWSQYGPFDRIIVTAEATDITAEWWSQLAPDGRVVVPVRLHGSGLTRALGLRRTGPDTMIADSSQVCGFVAMRGSSEQAGQQIRLHDGAMLKADAADLPDTAALSGVLASTPDRHWTGIRVRHDELVAVVLQRRVAHRHVVGYGVQYAGFVNINIKFFHSLKVLAH